MNNRERLSNFAVSAAFLACASCAGFGTQVHEAAARAAEDYADARADGLLDEPELRQLDRDFGGIQAALEEPSPGGFPVPATGIPWVDLILSLGSAAVAGIGAHKYTMRARDKARAGRGEQT